MTALLAAALAYLVGSIPFAVVVSRAMGLPDPRSFGSGNPGATNVLRSGSKLAAILTLAGDALKGWLPAWVAIRFELGEMVVAVVVVAAFLGHVFSVWLRFKGGKGVATAAGWMITEPKQADDAIRDEHADIVMLARELLRDPYWPYHAAEALGVEGASNILPVQYARSVRRR